MSLHSFKWTPALIFIKLLFKMSKIYYILANICKNCIKVDKIKNNCNF